MKRCTRCGTEKPTDAFYLRKKTGRPESWCKECRKQASRDQPPEAKRAATRRWQERNPEKWKAIQQASNLRRQAAKYGMTPEEYREALASACSLCGATDRRIHVDHCHDTDRVRGPLCGQCNAGIGMLGHDPDLLRRAAEWCS